MAVQFVKCLIPTTQILTADSFGFPRANPTVASRFPGNLADFLEILPILVALRQGLA